MASWGRTGAAAAAAVAVAAAVAAALVVPSGCVSAGRRTWNMEQKAESLAAAGDLAGADRAMGRVREREPAIPVYAVAHAKIKARRGQAGEALDLLQRAAALGLADEMLLADEAAFDTLRGEPRYAATVEAVRANRARFREQLAAARRPVDPAAARAFPDLASLRKALDEAERAPFEPSTIEAYRLHRARFEEEWAAALVRLATEKRGTPDEEGARYDLLRRRLDAAAGSDLVWTEDEGARVREAARAYLDACPKGEHAAAARLAAVAADAASVLPADFDYERDVARAPRCADALPALAELSADGTADRWSTLASGLHAVCLAKVDPSRKDEIRARLDAYDTGPHPDWQDATALDWLAPRAAKLARWTIDGPPPLAGTTADGRKVSLADFRGKVTLLDFWSPG